MKEVENEIKFQKVASWLKEKEDLLQKIKAHCFITFGDTYNDALVSEVIINGFENNESFETLKSKLNRLVFREEEGDFK